MTLNKDLAETISEIDTATLSEERKTVLTPLVDYIQSKQSAGEAIRINFICTHNSRRSHLAQIWTQALAYHFNIPDVHCYSGGTEATAMNAAIVDTLVEQGFSVGKLSETENPVYFVNYAENADPVVAFSKIYAHDFNPKSAFAAVMTCTDADAGCPFVVGAEKRVPITYEDPKVFDGTPQQAEKYRERSLEFATEIFHVFSQIKTLNG